MEELKIYWQNNKDRLCKESSIKAVYQAYKSEASEHLNEFKFREFIRKNGYCNSCTSDRVCKKCGKNSLNNR